MSIQLHPKHGLNPMLTNCFVCNEPAGVAIMGNMRQGTMKALTEAGAPPSNSGEAPRRGVVLDKEPCDECKGHMEKAVIVISVDEEKTDDSQNPYRTGGWCVMAESWVKRVVQPQELVDAILRQRVAFIPDDAWDALGLPRGEVNELPAEV